MITHFLFIRSTYREFASRKMHGDLKLFPVQVLLQGIDNFHIGSNGLSFCAEGAGLKELLLMQTRWKQPAFLLRDPLLQVGCCLFFFFSFCVKPLHNATQLSGTSMDSDIRRRSYELLNFRGNAKPRNMYLITEVNNQGTWRGLEPHPH